MRTRYTKEIEEAAKGYHLDPLLVEAVVIVESGGNTDAFRFEPDYWNRTLKGNAKYRGLNPRRVSSCYGLMGVSYARLVGDTIADAGTLPPEALFIPETGLRIGCAFLFDMFSWAWELPIPHQPTTPEFAALAAYHGGKGGNDPNKNWPLRNGTYAREVLGVKAQLAKEGK